MAETNEDNSTASSTEISTETPAGTSPAAATLLDDVKEIIASSGADVRARVVSALAEKAIGERVELTKKGLDKYNEARSNFRKVNKPDHTVFDGAGKKMEFMTGAKVEEIKKAKEALDRIEKALELALGKNDFTKLQETCK